MKKKKGFTLIELIVVIAIIGVLAAVLVPSLIGYINKARKLADKSTAANIGKTVNVMVASGDPEMKAAFYGSSSVISVTVERGNDTESYNLVTVCKSSSSGWQGISGDVQEFVDRINNSQYLSENAENIITRYHSGSKKSECYVIGFKQEENKVEVWTGDSGGNPTYRLWPDSDNEYV